MLKSFFASKQWALWAWGGMLLLGGLVSLEVSVHVWINAWYRETWDFLQNPHPLLKDAAFTAGTDWSAALSALDPGGEAHNSGTPYTADATLSTLAAEKLAKFWSLVGQFALVVFPFIFIKTFTNFFAQHYAFRWRQAITFAYLPLWTDIHRDIEGASQRLQEDPQKFAILVERLGIGLFRAVLTLIAFIPILFQVSTEIGTRFGEALGLDSAPFTLPFLTWTATTPGALMWVAVVLSIGGMLVSYLVGIKLPGLEYNNQKVEARFRKQLVYAEDDKGYAIPETMGELFTGLRYNYFRLYLHYSYFGVWANTFSQFIIIADLILIGSGIVLGVITLGFLNQISHAFSKVTESLTFFVDNWITVTELMSVVRRLKEFERNIGYGGTPLSEADLAHLPTQKL